MHLICSTTEMQLIMLLLFSAVTHADNGVYTCSLIGEQDDQDGNRKDVVLSKKSIKVIVLSKFCILPNFYIFLHKIMKYRKKENEFSKVNMYLKKLYFHFKVFSFIA